MTKVMFRKEGKAFLPIDPDAFQALWKIEDGQIVMADLKLVRDPIQLRKWWKFCDILAENFDTFADKRAVSDMILIAVHEVDWRVNPRTGETIPVPRSIAFGNMEDDVFERLWKRAKFYIDSEWMPIGTEKLEQEVAEFFAGPEARSLGRRVGTTAASAARNKAA